MEGSGARNRKSPASGRASKSPQPFGGNWILKGCRVFQTCAAGGVLMHEKVSGNSCHVARLATGGIRGPRGFRRRP